MEFGQTPKQLFTIPHPQRRVGTTLASPAAALPVTAPVAVATAVPAAAEAAAAAAAVAPEVLLAGLSLGGRPGADVTAPAPAASWGAMATSLAQTYTQKLHRGAVTCVRFAHGNDDIAFTVSQDTSLRMLALSRQEQLHSVNLCDLALSCCAPLPDDKTLVVGSWDNNVYFYSVEFGRVMDTLQGEGGSPRAPPRPRTGRGAHARAPPLVHA